MHEILRRIAGTSADNSSINLSRLPAKAAVKKPPRRSPVQRESLAKTKLGSCRLSGARARLRAEKIKPLKGFAIAEQLRRGSKPQNLGSSPSWVSFCGKGAANQTSGCSIPRRRGNILPSFSAKSEPPLPLTARRSSLHDSILKARRTILEQSYRRARGEKRHWWGTDANRLQEYTSKCVSLDRLYKSPKLRDNPSEYWLILEPLKTKQVELAAEALHTEAKVQNHRVKMFSKVSVLTTPTADTPGTTLLLFFENRRYLIGNIGEGLQRAMIQRGARMAKMEHAFITGVINWNSVGGLMGLILTLADVVTKRNCSDEVKGKVDGGTNCGLTLHGGRNLTHFLASTRRFVLRKGMPIQTNEFREESVLRTKEAGLCPTWKDENVMVWAMPISPHRHGQKRSYDMLADESALYNSQEAKGEEDAKNQIRRGVVSDMFKSEWRLDTLKTIKLAQVKQPAAIFQRNSEGKIEEYNGPLPGGGETIPDADVLVRNPWPGVMTESLPSTTPCATSMCYIFKQYPQRGRFEAKVAISLGVKPGPDFKTLTNGKSVTTADGTVVTPEMVLGKERRGVGIAVVDLPTRNYVENLIARKEWLSSEMMDDIESIIWILGKGVLEDERLLNFMQEHSKIRHEISSPDLCTNELALQSAATAAVMLNTLDPQRFSVPLHDNGTDDHETCSKLKYNKLQVGMTYDLATQLKINNKELVGPIDITQILNDFPEETLKLANEARKTINDPTYLAKLDELQKDLVGKDVEVITLGTGSALPSKYRNVSATMIRVPGYGNYLFDCGENTLGQLKRVFGAELPQILRDLKVLWISHLHADHHLGTVGVIKAFHEEMTSHDPTSTQKLMVASGDAVFSFLDEYAEVEDYGNSRIDPLSINLISNKHAEFNPSKIAAYGVSSIQACYVDHCWGALAVVFNFPNGFKVAYSGDCRPSAEFARIGKGATLLIHEATFDDELAGEALAKRHCTTSEALDVASRMGAQRVMLTHFSQRYQKIPVMDDVFTNAAACGEDGDGTTKTVEARRKDQVAIVGFDYMRCLVGDFAKAATFRPALVSLYESKEE